VIFLVKNSIWMCLRHPSHNSRKTGGEFNYWAYLNTMSDLPAVWFGAVFLWFLFFFLMIKRRILMIFKSRLLLFWFHCFFFFFFFFLYWELLALFIFRSLWVKRAFLFKQKINLGKEILFTALHYYYLFSVPLFFLVGNDILEFLKKICLTEFLKSILFLKKILKSLMN